MTPNVMHMLLVTIIIWYYKYIVVEVHVHIDTILSHVDLNHKCRTEN